MTDPVPASDFCEIVHCDNLVIHYIEKIRSRFPSDEPDSSTFERRIALQILLCNDDGIHAPGLKPGNSSAE